MRNIFGTFELCAVEYRLNKLSIKLLMPFNLDAVLYVLHLW